MSPIGPWLQIWRHTILVEIGAKADTRGACSKRRNWPGPTSLQSIEFLALIEVNAGHGAPIPRGTAIAGAIRLDLFLATRVWTNFAQRGPKVCPNALHTRTGSRLAGSQ